MKFSNLALPLMAGIVFLIVATHPSIAFSGLGMVKLIVTVLDENGQSIDDASLKTWFSSDKYPVKSHIDSHGVSEIQAESNDGVVVGEVTKDGYYPSIFHHDFFYTKFGRFLPWPKEISVVVRPIVNPVPMYVRNTFFDFPALNKEIGFDLVKSDWVIPYGQGTHADFIFTIERHIAGPEDFDASMILTFNNKYDGIQLIEDDGGGIFSTGSKFRLPRTAPLDGYLSKLERIKSTSAPDYYSRKGENNNFIFRVRSEVDEDGNLVRAIYGKVRGDIKFLPIMGELGGVRMHYYLNPDYTRNLEFDPKRNLSIVSDQERVEEP